MNSFFYNNIFDIYCFDLEPETYNAIFSDLKKNTIYNANLNQYVVDIIGKNMIFIKESETRFGITTLNTDGSFIYVPIKDYVGNDNFTFKINNGMYDSNVSKVDLIINDNFTSPFDYSLNSYVVTSSICERTITVQKNVIYNGNFCTLFNIIDSNVTCIMIEKPEYGDLIILSGGNFSFVPREDYSGIDGCVLNINNVTYDLDIIINTSLPVRRNSNKLRIKMYNSIINMKNDKDTNKEICGNSFIYND